MPVMSPTPRAGSASRGMDWAVMRVESNGDSRAISTAGAMGLMQIMPATWASLRARHGLGADPYDVRDNIMAGAAYLREMHDRYGDATAMLAAYNAGPGRYDDYRSRGRPLPAETRLSRPSGVDHRRRATCSLPPRRIPIRSHGGAPRCSCAWRVQPMPSPARSPVAGLLWPNRQPSRRPTVERSTTLPLFRRVRQRRPTRCSFPALARADRNDRLAPRIVGSPRRKGGRDRKELEGTRARYKPHPVSPKSRGFSCG
jgi:hypothetical protein